MEQILNYVIQINVLLVIVYLGYIFLLKNITFYRLNRLYFMLGILFSFVYPFLNVQSWFAKPIPSVGELVLDWSLNSTAEQVLPLFSLNQFLVILLVIGSAILFIRFLIQMGSLFRIHLHSEPAQWKSYFFRNVLIPIVPFSFLNKIYVNRDHHEEPELYDIFKHEDIHVQGLHTIDVLISEFALITSWFNPFVWLMRKAIRENLEFLTDQQVLNNGVDRQTYQYSLLRVNSHTGTAALGNQFSFKTLKRRIMMMNKKGSSKLQISKYAFMLPVLIFSAGAFTLNKAEAKISAVVNASKDIAVEMGAAVLIDKIADFNLPKKDSLSNGEISFNAIDFKKNYLFKIDARSATIEEVKALKKDAVVAVYFYRAGTYSILHTDDLDKEGLIVVRTKEDFEKKERLKAEAVKRVRLYLIDGKEVSLEELKAFDSKQALNYRILKKDEGIAQFGEKGKNGVFEIYTTNAYPSFDINALQGKVSGIKIENPIDASLAVSKTKEFNLTDATIFDGSTSIRAHKINSAIKGNPLIIIDGKTASIAAMEALNQLHIKSIHIYKDQAALDKYGDKAQAGAIEITMKTDEELLQATPETIAPNRIEGKASPVSLNTTNRKGSPLFVIDGELKDDQTDFNALSPDAIASITILKDSSAVALYGSRGVNGVFLVSTKGSAFSAKNVADKGNQIIVRGYKKTSTVGNKTAEVTELGYQKSEDEIVKPSDNVKKKLSDNK